MTSADSANAIDLNGEKETEKEAEENQTDEKEKQETSETAEKKEELEDSEEPEESKDSTELEEQVELKIHPLHSCDFSRELGGCRRSCI